MLIFDLESDGLLDAITTLHCISIHDTEDGKFRRYHGDMNQPRDGSIDEALELLANADVIAGHNIIGYDIPAIQLLYPGWKPRGRVIDTLVITRLIYTDLKDRDFAQHRARSLPDNFIKMKLLGKHSLKAWGYRLGVLKGEYGETADWSVFTREMMEYCEQDVVVTVQLWEKLQAEAYSQEAIDLELEIADIVGAMERHGFRFNEESAVELYTRLVARRYELEQELCEIFPPFYLRDGKNGKYRDKQMRRWQCSESGAHLRKVGKEKRIERGYWQETTPNGEFCRVKLVEFNPGSRQHIADRLINVLGWRPTEFTDTGQPKVDETTLAGLTSPAAKKVREFLMVQKRAGQISEGANGWLQLSRGGRIYGRVNPMGTRTGRMSHFFPNVAQVPAVGSEYGAECRALFMADDGWALVGTDADGLELRDLAHYLHWYDQGAYAEIVLNGDKAKGTDIHTQNQKAIGLNSRDSAKTFIYALIYGAGDAKIGLIILEDMEENERRSFFRRNRTPQQRENALRTLGRNARKKMYRRFPAIEKLTNDVKDANKARGYVTGLDGRRLVGSSDHAALNTLLQSAGAIAMKKAIVMFVRAMEAAGHEWGRDYAIVAMVHDEIQVTCRKEIVDDVKRLSVDAIRRAGEYFKMLCPLDGSSDAGATWADTH